MVIESSSDIAGSALTQDKKRVNGASLCPDECCLFSSKSECRILSDVVSLLSNSSMVLGSGCAQIASMANAVNLHTFDFGQPTSVGALQYFASTLGKLGRTMRPIVCIVLKPTGLPRTIFV